MSQSFLTWCRWVLAGACVGVLIVAREARADGPARTPRMAGAPAPPAGASSAPKVEVSLRLPPFLSFGAGAATSIAPANAGDARTGTPGPSAADRGASRGSMALESAILTSVAAATIAVSAVLSFRTRSRSERNPFAPALGLKLTPQKAQAVVLWRF